MSALVSLALLIVLGGMWVRVYTAPPAPEPSDTVVTTPEEVRRYLAAVVPAPEDKSEPPIYIPTGMYIEAIEFNGPYNVDVSGFVWQRYANDLPDDLDKGSILPEAERFWLEEVYRAQQGNEELIGWSFTARLRQQFDYRGYPLGRQHVWIQLWYKDFVPNVYLAPDLGAYTSLDPAALPGLDTDLVLEDWHILESFYSYRAVRYNADLITHSYSASQVSNSLCRLKRATSCPAVARVTEAGKWSSTTQASTNMAYFAPLQNRLAPRIGFLLTTSRGLIVMHLTTVRMRRQHGPNWTVSSACH